MDTRTARYRGTLVAGILVALAPGCAPPPEPGPVTSDTAVFEISGMDCETCEHAVEAAIRKLEGVHDVRASRANSIIVVVHDPDRVRPEAIEASIERLGYDALLADGVTPGVVPAADAPF